MITGRATQVTRSSINAFYKLCHGRSYWNSIKVAPLCKSLSYVAEASPRYQIQVGNDSDPPESWNQDWVGGGSGVRSSDSVHDNQGLGNEGYGGNWDKPNAYVSESRGLESHSFDRNVGENRRISSGNGVGEYRQEWDGYKWSNVKEPARGQGVNLTYQSGDLNYRGDGGHLQNGSGGQFLGNVGGLRSENGGMYSKNGVNYTNYQPSGLRVPSGNSRSVSNVGQYQPPSNNNYAQSNFGQYQQENNENRAASNYGQYQQVDNNNYAPSVRASQHAAMQQNGFVGSPTANHSHYQGSTVAGYQQYPYRNLIYHKNTGNGPLPSNTTAPYPSTVSQVPGSSNMDGNLICHKNTGNGPLPSNTTAPYPSTVSQVPGSSNMDGNSSDALETPQIRGTIEELEKYSKDGKLKEALEVLELLGKNQQRFVPERDFSIAVMLMEACGEAKADKEAKVVHRALVKLLSPLTVTTYNKILDMYLKCGSIEEAYSLFNEIPNADVASWDTMIRGLVKNDLGEEAIDIFTEFKNTELKPNGQMFLGVFSACGIVGDVTEGMLHFHSMSKQYGITPSMEHYVGVVEMLGHAGYLDNALEFVEKIPVEPSIELWETLMHVSRIQGNMELGDRCAELVEKLDPSRLSEQAKAGLIPIKASDLEKDKEKKKLASKNLLEVRSRVHEYRAGDTSHPENDRIYALLRGLKTQMKEAGYIPELRGVLHDIDPEGKEEALLAHSERLAAAYGFLTTAARQPIRVIKNLRVCVDCHNALKIISKLVGRELIMRDAKRFHHFKDGVCSCKDYW